MTRTTTTTKNAPAVSPVGATTGDEGEAPTTHQGSENLMPDSTTPEPDLTVTTWLGDLADELGPDVASELTEYRRVLYVNGYRPAGLKPGDLEGSTRTALVQANRDVAAQRAAQLPWETVQPVVCAPWCEDGVGHPRETHPVDQWCNSEEFKFPGRGFGSGSFIGVFARFNHGTEEDPDGGSVALHFFDSDGEIDRDLKLTTETARDMGLALLRAADQAAGEETRRLLAALTTAVAGIKQQEEGTS